MELFPQWFDQHPESDICYFGTLLCGICNLVGFFSLSSNQEETMKQLSYSSLKYIIPLHLKIVLS